MARVALLMIFALGTLAGVPATASADWGTSPVKIQKITPNPQKGSLRVELAVPSSSYYKDEAQLTVTATSTIAGKQVVVAGFSGAASGSASTYDLKPTPAALKTLKAKQVLKAVLTVTFTPAGGNPAPSHDSAATAFKLLRYPLAECNAGQSVSGIPERKGDDISVRVDYAGQGISCAGAKPLARAWAKCALAPLTSKGICAKTVSGFRCKSSDLDDDADSGADGGVESQATITLTGKVSCQKLKRKTGVLLSFSLERPNPVAVRECPNGPVAYSVGSLSDFEQANTTCSTAVKVAQAHTNCRLKTGPRGHCISKVLGYSCREERTTSTTTSGTVTCSSGLKRVRFNFTQS